MSEESSLNIVIHFEITNYIAVITDVAFLLIPHMGCHFENRFKISTDVRQTCRRKKK